MIFKHICKKGNKYLTKIIFEEDKGEKWATTSEAVYNWAKKNFKDGDSVDVEYNIKNGQYFVTRISAPGQAETKKQKKETTTDSAKYSCTDCGKELKDDKYEKCYTCNKKSPGTRKSKSSDTADAISRQNANHATSRALIALQGQVDVNTIFEIAPRLHEMFLRLARGE